MDGTWCMAWKSSVERAATGTIWIRPFDYLKFMGVELEQDLSWITPHVMRLEVQVVAVRDARVVTHPLADLR